MQSLTFPAAQSRSFHRVEPRQVIRFDHVIEPGDFRAMRAGIALGLGINALALAIHFGPALIAALYL